MTGDVDFMLSHWKKAKALSDWLVYRWEASISDYTEDDPRYGIPPGLDEGDGFIGIFAGHPGSHSGYANQLEHMYLPHPLLLAAVVSTIAVTVFHS